jgi:heat shock protein HtpX
VYQQIAANKRKTWLIMLFFVAIIAGIGWVYGQYASQPLITPYVIAGALVYAMGSYLLGSRTALAVNGAKQIQKSDNPRLWRVVENLAITEGLPMPKVYIMDDPALNAFATGRNPAHASVCATSGLLAALDDNELQGVFAHEMGHVKNYDIRVSMIAFALVAAIGILSDILLRLTWFGNRRNSNQLILVLGIAAAIIAPLVAGLIQLAISRRREYLADATGALATRYPEGLAQALEKIASSGSTLRKQNSSTAHLFFANPLSSGALANLFSTHPPIEERIRRLRAMESHA